MNFALQEIRRDELKKISLSYDAAVVKIKATPEYLDASKPYSQISLVELASLFYYTINNYQPINKGLRSGDWRLLTDLVGETKAAASGLNKMPVYTGTVTRGSSFHPVGDSLTHQDDYQVGRVVAETGFSSTTTGDSDTSDFCGNTKWIITSTAGHSVAWMSGLPGGAGDTLCARLRVSSDGPQGGVGSGRQR